jgi:hypothetical protein
VWGLVVDETGLCIVGATVQIVGSQGVGEPVMQSTPCDAWADRGGVIVKNLASGVPTTFRVSAPGFVTQDTSVVPSGPTRATLFTLSRAQ